MYIPFYMKVIDLIFSQRINVVISINIIQCFNADHNKFLYINFYKVTNTLVSFKQP